MYVQPRLGLNIPKPNLYSAQVYTQMNYIYKHTYIPIHVDICIYTYIYMCVCVLSMYQHYIFCTRYTNIYIYINIHMCLLVLTER